MCKEKLRYLNNIQEQALRNKNNNKRTDISSAVQMPGSL